MPNLTCPDCSAEIQDSSKNCPRCGCPPEELREAGWQGTRSTDGSVDERFSIEAPPVEPVPDKYTFFQVGPFKLAAMSLCTLGLYNVYWSFHQWSRIRERTGESLSPAWRGLLSPIWNFSLFARIQAAADAEDLPREWSPILMGAAYLFLPVASAAPLPVGLVGFLSFVPLVFVQQTIVRISQTEEAKESPNDAFSGLDIFAIMGAWVLLVLLRALVPVPA